MFTVVESYALQVSDWFVVDSHGEERFRSTSFTSALAFAALLIAQAAEYDPLPTYAVSLSFPGMFVPGFISAPAFDSWTREYGSYHSALDAAADLADLYAGNAVVTIVEVLPHITYGECGECGVPLRVVGRASDLIDAPLVCPACQDADSQSTLEVPWWRAPSPEPNW